MKKLLDYIARELAKRLVEKFGSDGIRVAVVNIQPGDFIVLKSENEVSDELYTRLMETMKGIFPDNKCIVLDVGLDLGVLKKDLRL